MSARLFKFFFMFTVMLLSKNIFAQNGPFNIAYTKFGLNMVQLAGEDGQSFTEGVSTAGVEISRVLTNSWFGVETKVRGGTVGGTQDFDDSGTDVSADYNYDFGEFADGARFSLIPSSNKGGFTSYLGVAGVVQFGYLSLETDTNTNLPKNQSATNYGYDLVAGGELRFKTNGGGFYILYADIGVRSMTGKLVDQDKFSLGGLTISLGLGF